MHAVNPVVDLGIRILGESIVMVPLTRHRSGMTFNSRAQCCCVSLQTVPLISDTVNRSEIETLIESRASVAQHAQPSIHMGLGRGRMEPARWRPQ